MLSTDAAVELRGHGDSVLCLDSDPSRLASASSDGSVRLWDLNSCRVARALMLPETAEAQSVVLGRGSGPAANCVFAAADRTIYAYDLRAPAVVMRQPTQLIGAAHEEVAQMVLTDDGAQLAAADDAGAVHIFDLVAAGRPPVVLQAHESICATLAFRPPATAAAAGLQLCSGGMDARCVQWDVASASALAEWSLGIAEEPPKAASSGGAGSSEGQEAGADYVAPTSFNPRFVHNLSYAPDGRTVAIALGDGSFEFRQADSGSLLAARGAHRAACSQVGFTSLRHVGAPSDGASRSVVLTAGDDRQLCLWAVEGLGEPAQAVRAPPPGDGDGAKRRKGDGGGGAPQERDGGGGERRCSAVGPGVIVSQVGATVLPDKPNWVVQVGNTLCVADNGTVVRVYAVPQ